MPHVLIRHKVKDFAKWKPIYDAHGATRKESGSRGAQLFRNASDPNELLILLQWVDLDKARKFAESEDLKQAMQRAGVADRPDIYYIEEVEQAPA